MKSQNKTDAFEIIKQFQSSVLQHTPSVEKMYDEVRMMKFKIKPLQGDISLLNFKNQDFISALWSLGKLDEFFQSHFTDLQPEQQDIFFKLMDEMRYEFQNQLNKANIKPSQNDLKASTFEMEIFKEKEKSVN